MEWGDEKSKHIEVKYQMIMSNVQKGVVNVSHIPTDHILADKMAKIRPIQKHKFLLK